ncbi:MFS permease protein [Melissococcus plutonius]|uniref:MFS transporter n=1 Tax=Melissococcus plutonius TaxID=33970 RepID=UPI00065E395D|nr:MFS transporter [Melissococcus plutonius]AIM24792.1 MFS permease protein [Melissococcus plutonius S1]KMT24909.1 MFS permease protein [Melissococcus plutonius]KMT26546.1 MFS permease protein [Melissococcus plutonius]KMT27796.1 MFS permease protein [Melissococcus plutonius]KMT29568.1 MFS permease protein [Melissococcus plutonius]
MKNKQPLLTKTLISLLTLTCGVVVANMYYIQPIGTQIAKSFHVTTGSIGLVTMLTQLGYAFGLLFLVPLGDRMDQRKLIIRMTALSSISLLFAFLAPTYSFFAFSTFLIGLLSIVPQIIIPYGAILAGPKNRGKIMGKLLSGLLIGVLFSRTISGILASILPWKSIYLVALVAIAILTILLKFKMPKTEIQKSSDLSYLYSLKSTPYLVKSQIILREAAINGFFMFGTFSIFWSTLIFYISSPAYHWGPREAGILAVLGLSGAASAPIVGRLSDAYTQRNIVLMGLFMQLFSFVLLFFFGSHLSALLLAIIFLDIGMQFGQVANQTSVQNLGEAASNRNNTVFMFCYFIGGSFGSLIGTIMWQQACWVGVTLAGITFQILAFIFHFVIFGKKPKI